MFNPMSNTGTMTAADDGPLEMARSLVEFQDEDGELAVPKDAYAKADAHIYGLALVWRGSALAWIGKPARARRRLTASSLRNWRAFSRLASCRRAGTTSSCWGEQSIRVQHVTVNDGGQAIVGDVQAGGGATKETGGQPHEPCAANELRHPAARPRRNARGSAAEPRR